MRISAFVLVLAGSRAAAAQEYVVADGPLSDGDFYRAVACAAPPGGACVKPFLRWPEARRKPLRVGLASVADAASPARRAAFVAALDAAIAAVDAVTGGGLRLARDDDRPDVAIHVVATPPYRVISGTGDPTLDGATLEFARVALTSRDGTIQRGAIAVTMHLPAADLTSVLLEEVAQATGLITDIEGPAYAASVFSEDHNRATRLVGQDAMAIRRHYAPTFDATPAPDGDDS